MGGPSQQTIQQPQSHHQFCSYSSLSVLFQHEDVLKEACGLFREGTESERSDVNDASTEEFLFLICRHEKNGSARRLSDY